MAAPQITLAQKTSDEGLSEAVKAELLAKLTALHQQMIAANVDVLDAKDTKGPAGSQISVKRTRA
jgi:hypothetical protein